MVKTSSKKNPNSRLKAGQKKSINKWFIVAGVAAVAVVGVLVVRYSGASGNNAWTRYPNQMKLETGSGKAVIKRDGTPTFLLESGTAGFKVSPYAMRNTSRVCADVKYGPNNIAAALWINNGGFRKGIDALFPGKPGKSAKICTRNLTNAERSKNVDYRLNVEMIGSGVIYKVYGER